MAPAMETKRFVYVLRSLTNPQRHYVGLTSNAERRLAWHNAGQNVHTVRDRPWQIVVCKQFNDHNVAGRFERNHESGSGRAFAKPHFA